jgi:HEPN domain-containing protein
MKSRRDALTDAAAQWVQKAENDLTTAMAVTRLGGKYPTDSVCFHAQQCAEKYYKAVLVSHGIDFPRTHDLNALARLLPGLLLSTLTDEERRRLT